MCASIIIFLYTERYNKDPYGTPDGEILGAKQWKWLEEEVQTSKATFNLIASGIQILPGDRWFGGENWDRFPKQRERLVKTIIDSNASGIILLRYSMNTLLIYAYIENVTC